VLWDVLVDPPFVLSICSLTDKDFWGQAFGNSMPTKVLIGAHSDLVKRGLAEILLSTDSIEVVGQSHDIEEAKALIASHRPTVAILDPDSLDINTFELVSSLRQEFPETRLLVLASQDDSAVAQELLSAGVHGYIVANASGAEIIAAIQTVAAGRHVVNISTLSGIFTETTLHRARFHGASQNRPVTQQLSEREHEVLVRVARGQTNQQIAEELFLSVKTIETYRARVGKKIGATNRAELFEYAYESGMLEDTPC
jgi:two-component system, NarL family, response regulator NreC